MKKNIIYITKIYMKFYFIIILFWTTHFIVINMKIDIASEVAHEICMSVIIHNMNINYIKNQLQLFDDIETENV